jgi:hypothetical protein
MPAIAPPPYLSGSLGIRLNGLGAVPFFSVSSASWISAQDGRMQGAGPGGQLLRTGRLRLSCVRSHWSGRGSAQPQQLVLLPGTKRTTC